MCAHKNVYITPTSDTAWENDDKYHLRCFDCDQILLANCPAAEIKTYLHNFSKSLISGHKYL